MTDRDKLINLITKSNCVDVWDHYLDDFKDPNPIATLADNILADGWIRPPCKVGDIVWDRNGEPHKVISIEWYSEKVMHLHCEHHTFSVGKRSLGKTVFLTREDVEAASKELNSNA